MAITMQEAAARLDGNEYTREGSPELWAEMKAAGLVAVFGASDDLMEFRGAVDDEASASNGGAAYFSRAGLLVDECKNEYGCPYFKRLKERATVVTAAWCPPRTEAAWVIATKLPHATFKIMEDGKVFCVGLVFALADCPEV